MIDISKAMTIPGWMTRKELTWLAGRAQEHRVIVEIGSYLGRSTRALADHTPGIVYAVDDWIGPRDVMLGPDRATLFSRFKSNLADLGDKVQPIRCDHKEVSFQGAYADMVFIDGDHESDSVEFDIEFWLPRISFGGLICGHDIDFVPVNESVRKLLPEARVVPETSLWFYIT